MAAPAYNRYATAPATVPQRPRRTQQRSNVRVVPGSRPVQQTKSPSNFVVIAAVVAVVLVIFAFLSFARVAISSATIATSIDSQAISSQIETARSEGNKLEVSESTLSNPSTIKDKATKLGMSAATQATTIALEQDVVVQDSEGNLSLAESVRRASSVA